ncbi:MULTISPECIES: acetate uptake transporter [unclassified Streptomyces]|uniref:acetate uptake transporter n=1 Tax=unclassified Streptomyces TaxID=2593676 RepID=UPI00226EC0C8|nr:MULTISPECIES: acetate uptake transporter [unclassified Streptomyces]MCY0916740.1 acetate uptake transporter [Streptomyces sp. H27-G5]MCY0959034.1 acetate uptake transporter [Streptomyces sp. H27-H5]
MDNGVSAGSTASTSTLGHIALGLTLLAFGIGHTGIIDGVSAANSVSLATYVGGLALFVLGILEFRGGDGFNGTAFAGLGAFWFTWAAGADGKVSADAAGAFLVLFALLGLTLTVGAASGLFGQGVYALFTLSLLLLAVGAFADSGLLAKIAGWVAAVAGLLAWYGATAALAHWPVALGSRARRDAVPAS